MSFTVSECARCGHRVYPARLWCPACGHDQARAVVVDEAELLAWTRVPGSTAEDDRFIATVQALPQGPALVVRLTAAPGRVGQRLRLTTRVEQGVGLPWADFGFDSFI
ncbi:zinc ribbon domain-containing protein [Achromobacter sp. UMC71]|uniref:zinc ribbon domain-containing protein n=1 Tax=Achromobacter sp. UMC71 TaxID=1862320 RepID=UPI001600B2D8|nr:zinc ribbon domain-containing protein [Achromobacter sp. UMC71]MBB1627122.1 hypothetical protein [Achromobacter sp. UMC71]